MKIGYTGDIDQLCRSAPLLIGQLKTETDGLTELGSACYGSGENLKIRVSVAISSGREYLVVEKLHFRGLLKFFCEKDELYRVARRVPIVWTYYTAEGRFSSEFPFDMDLCKATLD